MRDAVKRKLHSQAGASLLIALIYFLTAMMVGAVVLTAAATNAGRLARNRQEQQDYLAVASAAQLVEEDIRGITFEAGYNKVESYTTVIAEDGWETNYSGPSYNKVGEGIIGADEGHNVGLILTNIEGDLKQLYYSTVPDGISGVHGTAPAAMDSYTLEIAAELTGGTTELPTVSGTMKVDMTEGARYTITVKLYIEKDGKQTNATTLTFAPVVNSTEETTREWSVDGMTETVTTTTKTTVAWVTPVITKEAAA